MMAPRDIGGMVLELLREGYKVSRGDSSGGYVAQCRDCEAVFVLSERITEDELIGALEHRRNCTGARP